MKLRLGNHIETCRCTHPTKGSSPVGETYGFFIIDQLRILSSGSGNGEWEHVSVSCVNRCPTWNEMDWVKHQFWMDEETVIQFHPRETQKKNIHENCLHMWRKPGMNIELPPEWSV